METIVWIVTWGVAAYVLPNTEVPFCRAYKPVQANVHLFDAGRIFRRASLCLPQ